MNLNKDISKIVKRIDVVDEHHNLKSRFISYKGSGEDAYIKFYLKDISYLSGLSHYHYEILFSIMKRIDYKDKSVTLNKKEKEEIALETGLKYGTVHNAIYFLKDNEVLFTIGRGKYILNPYLMCVGDWQSISEIRAEIVWRPEGKTIKTVNYHEAKDFVASRKLKA